MDFSFTEEQRMMRESVRKLMDRIATPDYVRRLDREQGYPEELYAAWVELGLLRTRTSSISGLYAAPSTRTFEPFKAFPRSFIASMTRVTT